jgi:hypothetical protein
MWLAMVPQAPQKSQCVSLKPESVEPLSGTIAYMYMLHSVLAKPKLQCGNIG